MWGLLYKITTLRFHLKPHTLNSMWLTINLSWDLPSNGVVDVHSNSNYTKSWRISPKINPEYQWYYSSLHYLDGFQQRQNVDKESFQKKPHQYHIVCWRGELNWGVQCIIEMGCILIGNKSNKMSENRNWKHYTQMQGYYLLSTKAKPMGIMQN